MDTEARARKLTTAVLNAQRKRIVEGLSESLSGSTHLLPVHSALLDTARAEIRVPDPRRAIAGVHRALATGEDRNDLPALISGQMVLWSVLHGTLREVEGSHKSPDAIHTVLSLAGDAVDGITGVLIDVAQSGETSVAFPGWRTLVELGRVYREFHALNRTVRDLLDARDPGQMFEVLQQGILGTFHLRSLVIAAVNQTEQFVEVISNYPSHPEIRDPIGWRFDLSHPDILCDVARSGRVEVIDGWDPRYHERVVQSDGSIRFRQRPMDWNEGHTAFFVPILTRDRAVGVVCTASTQTSKQMVLQEIERMQPFLHQVGATLSTVSEVIERKRAEEELRCSRGQLRDLSASLQSAREEERTRIAREVHDELGQVLTVLKMDLTWMGNRLTGDQASLKERARSMTTLIDATIQTVRRISTELRPGVLDDLGLPAAVEWQAQEFQSRTGIWCGLTIRPEEIPLDRARATAVFRIFQEILTNVVRHADATRADILLREKEGCVTLEVTDDGKGITQDQILSSKSLGLIGMRERALAWNGEVEIHGEAGRGTRVTVRIPAERQQEGP
ncbi:MAG: sensor histidine kinase [Candidatus Latescibacteria bacterium]|nr:sensor histidine kinase [Candidatus Latescibacterota bacterium]